MGKRIGILAPIFILLITGPWSVDESQAAIAKTQAKHISAKGSSQKSGAGAHIVKHKKSGPSAHRTKQSKPRLTKIQTKHKKTASPVRTRAKRARVARLIRNHRETPSYHYFGPMSAGADAILSQSAPADEHWLSLSAPDQTDDGPFSLTLVTDAECPSQGAELVIAQTPGPVRSVNVRARDGDDDTVLTDLWQIKALQASLDKKSETEAVNGLTVKILETAYNYLGVRYRYGGSTPEGFDCSGFVRYVFSENGIQLGRSSREQALEGMHVPLSALKPGDLIFFDMGSRKHHRIDHVGLYIGDGQFIHAASSRSRQIMISDLKSAHYQRRVVTARRITASTP